MGGAIAPPPRPPPGYATGNIAKHRGVTLPFIDACITISEAFAY